MEGNEQHNPYPGLRAYEKHEAHLFFGRRAQVGELLTRVAQARFCAVLGTSGAGKSSLVTAGLIPALEAGAILGVDGGWHIARFRPGVNPIQNLSLALAQTTWASKRVRMDAPRLEQHFSGNAQALAKLLERGALAANERLLVVVDQFEEIFRYHQHASNEARRFVNLLVEAVNFEELSGLRWVLTMRAEFLGYCALYDGLPELINKGSYTIPHLTRDELTEAITLPALLGDGYVEDELTEALLSEEHEYRRHVPPRPALPLIQHLLYRLWNEAGEDKALTLKAYEKFGSVGAALEDHLEEAYRELGPVQRTIAETLFRALTEPGKTVSLRSSAGNALLGRSDIRRPTRLSKVAELAQADVPALENPVEEVIEVVDVFRRSGRHFLKPTTRLHPGSLLDISHESLIDAWRRLQEWRTVEGRKLEEYRSWLDDAKKWSDGKAPLWEGRFLAEHLEDRKEYNFSSEWVSLYAGDHHIAEGHREMEVAEAFLTWSELWDAALESNFPKAKELLHDQSQFVRPGETIDRLELKEVLLQRLSAHTHAPLLLGLLPEWIAEVKHRTDSKVGAEPGEKESMARVDLSEQWQHGENEALEKGFFTDLKLEVRAPKGGATVLHFVALGGNHELFESLLELEADPDAKTDGDVSPFCWALAGGHLETAQRVAACLGRPVRSTVRYTTSQESAWNSPTVVSNAPSAVTKEDTSDERTFGRTALHYAQWSANADVTQWLLEAGAEVEAQDEKRWRPLHVAAWFGHVDNVEVLLKHRAQPEALGPDGASALIIAAAGGYVEVVQLLLDGGAEPSRCDDNGHTALHAAAQAGHTEVVQLLLDGSAEPSHQNSTGHTALTLASVNGHTDVVRVLLRGDVDADHPDNEGWSPLMLAAYEGHIGVLEVLLAHGVDIDGVRPATGWTALMAASREGHHEAVRLLVENGAMVDKADDHGNTALMEAAGGSHPSVVKLLTLEIESPERRANPAHRNKKEQTPLHLAATKGDEATVKILLEALRNRGLGGGEVAGEVGGPDVRGRSPLDYAMQHGHFGVAALLADTGISLPLWYEMVQDDDGTAGLRPLRGESLRRHLMEHWPSNEDEKKSQWPLFPLINGDWILLGEEEAIYLLVRAAEFMPPSVRSVARVDGLRVLKIPFYPGAQLCEARGRSDDGEVVGYLTFIDYRGGIAWLDGTSPPIHRLNAELPIRLNDNNVTDYLRFFCAAVHGEHGAFTLLESPEQIQWLDSVDQEVRAKGSALAKTVEVELGSEGASKEESTPVEAEADPKPGDAIDEGTEEEDASAKTEEGPTWKAEAVVRYSNALFAADFRVLHTGMVEMVDDVPIATHLDLEAEVIENGLRTLRAITDDKAPEFESERSWAPLRVEEADPTPWSFPPLIVGDWSFLDRPAASALLEQVPKSLVAEAEIEYVDGVRVQRLSFYPGARLCEARAWRDGQVAGLLTFIDHPEWRVWLNGTAPVIHQLNEKLSVQLNDDTAPEYLRFFCAAVHGDRGAFRIVEAPDQLLWLPEAPEDAREDRTLAREIVLESQPGEEHESAWEAKAIVHYGGQIFEAGFRLLASGMVEMLSDEPRRSDLPLYVEVFERRLRKLRPASVEEEDQHSSSKSATNGRDHTG